MRLDDWVSIESSENSRTHGSGAKALKHHRNGRNQGEATPRGAWVYLGAYSY